MDTERIEGDRVADVVPRLIAEQFGRGVTLDNVKPESRLVADLKADDLDKLEIVMALEDEFDIEIDDGEDDALLTVGDCISIVNRKLHAMTIPRSGAPA